MSMSMPVGQVTNTGIGGQPSQSDLQAAALARINAQTGNQNPAGVVHNPLQPPVMPTAEPMHGISPAGFGGGQAPVPNPIGGPPGLPPMHNPIAFPGGAPPINFPGGNPNGGPPVGGPPPGANIPPAGNPIMNMLMAAAQRKMGQ